MQWIFNAFLYNDIVGAGENNGISFWIFWIPFMSEQQRSQTRHAGLSRSVRTSPTIWECSISRAGAPADLRNKTEASKRINLYTVCFAVEI